LSREGERNLVDEIISRLASRIDLLEKELGDPLIYVKSSDEFTKILGDYEVVVAVFSTTWCNPCQAYIPVVRKVARKYITNRDNIAFIYVDTDILPDIADKYHVDNLPTTIIFLNAHVADVIVGVTTLARLEEKVETLIREIEGR